MASPSVDESEETQVQPTHHEQIYAMVELAQVCHFCTTFQTPLKLPSFSRTDLQAALLSGTSGDEREIALLAEVHFKLVREQGAKLERMIQEWERAVTRKVTDNWRLEFSSNPFDGATYDDLTIAQRIQILNALCHWKLESCAEIQKHLSVVQKDTDPKALEALRTTPIGYDDAGSTYWYFGDCCWVYAEDRPEWQSQGLQEYAVEFADGKRIRLSINFDPKHTTVPQLVEPVKSAQATLSNGEPPASADKMQIATLVEQIDEEDEEDEPLPSKKGKESQDEPEMDVKPLLQQEDKAPSRKMDITMLCESPSAVVSSPKPEPMTQDDRDVSEDQFMSTIVSTKDSIKSEIKNGEEMIDEKNNNIATPHNNGSAAGENMTEKKRRLSDEHVDNKHDVKLEDDRSVPQKKRKTRFHDVFHGSTNVSQPLPDKVNTAVTEESTETPAEVPADQVEPVTADNSATNDALHQDEDFDIICETCHRSYDRRYLDPPLEKRPVGEWRCFECLVNDARGWPRRRNPTSKTPKSTTADAAQENEGGSSRKKRSSSSSRSKSKSSSKKKSSSHSSSSTHKKGSSSKKSSKKHKKSSSSSRHHSSSSRHHHNRHREEYAKLLKLAQGRKRERLAIEEERLNGTHLCPVSLDGPTGWRVVCCSVEGLRQVIEKLAGGSLDQDRLRGRLISILKVEEKMEAERLKKREQQLWQVLPRRQSSRVAMGRIKNQHSGDSASDSDEENDGGRGSRHSSRLRGSTNGHDRLARDRESRARRRRAEDDSESNSESDQDSKSPPHAVDGWINWSSVKGDNSLMLVCSGLIDRLLKEEISDLFSRPVDPEQDGCPDYLTVIQQPMDLGTIRKRVNSGFYTAWEPFKTDVDRVWKNCRQYNPPDTIVVEYADALDEMFKQMRKEAERKGIRKMGRFDADTDDKTVDEDDEDMNPSSDDESVKGKSKSDSSASEASSDESDESSEASSDDDDDAPGRKTRNASNSTPRPSRTSTRPTRSSGVSSTKTRTSRRKAKNSDSEEEAESSSDGDEDDVGELGSDISGEGGTRRSSRSRPRRGSQNSKRPELKEGSKPTRSPSTPNVDVSKQAEDAKPKQAAGRRKNRIDDGSDSSSSEGSVKGDDTSSSSASDDGDDVIRRKKATTKASSRRDSDQSEQIVPAETPPPPSTPPPPPPPTSTTNTPSSNRKPKPPTGRGGSSPNRSPASSSSYFSSSDSDSSAGGSDSSDSD